LSSNVTLFGKWELDSYTITYQSNGGSDVLSKTYTALETTYEPTEPTKDGYIFAGWYTNSACTNPFSFGSTLTSNITLYAKWSAITYTISFVTNGGTNVNDMVFTAQENTYAPTEPSYEGYEFEGWYIDEGLKTKFSFGSKLTKNVTLYAKWSVKVVLSSDATLSNLKVNGNSVSNFNPLLTSYNVTLTPGLSSFVISANTNDINATILSGLGSYDIESGNIINVTVKVRAQDGTTLEYKIKVTSPVESDGEGFIYYAGINEIIAATFIDSNPKNATAYYRLNGTTTYTKVDQELVRSVDGVGRVDILGLKAGLYDIKVVKSNSEVIAVDGIRVAAQDRSGYAHFDNSKNAIGAYNDDGTLKSNAIIIYVSNATKNTVKYGSYTGLVSILTNLKNINSPVVIRVLDSITTNQFKPKSDEPRLADNSNYKTTSELTAYYTNTLETKYGENLVGMPARVTVQGKYTVNYTATANSQTMKTSSRSSSSTTTYSGSEYSSISGKKVYDDDSYFNMVDITSTKGLTIEGVGTNAEFFQWGLTFNKSKNVEVRNITFTSQPEDACSFNGSSNDDMDYYGFWLHNCTFNRGINNWDVTGERDKYAGDGATDVRFCHGVTTSYNVFNNTKKTGLVGGSDSNYQYNITFHHNYYNAVESRLPLGRQANMHIYNNYYLNCKSTLSIRANGYVFLEGNYFEKSKNPQVTTVSSSDYYPQIKGYNNIFNNCSGTNNTQTVSNRTDSISGVKCSINGVSYVGFDTNSSLFYYDSVNKVSKVEVLTSPEQAKLDCIAFAGVLKNNQTNSILG
ncbi:MAG: InlB B-repeat-containing protein, partial [Acholeplasmatales bacterium]|nr:InlB B-repeat-containing protein [Acholeplasmatales bacterium]